MIGPPRVAPNCWYFVSGFSESALAKEFRACVSSELPKKKALPAQLVRPRLHDDRGHRAAGAAELGVEVRRGHVDGVDRLGGGDQDREQAGLVVVVDAVDLHVVRQARLAVELGLLAVLRVEELRVRPGERDRRRARWPTSPGSCGSGRGAAPGPAGPRSSGRCRRGRSGAAASPATTSTVSLIAPTSRITSTRTVGVDLHLDAVADELLEAGELGLDPVEAVLQVGEDVVAAAGS